MPRIRVFAGPNGSGKTTLLRRLADTSLPLYHVINPDDLEQQLTSEEGLDLSSFGIHAPKHAFVNHIRRSTYSSTVKRAARKIRVEKSVMFARLTRKGSYNAALVASFIRAMLIAQKESFSFESVFSHPSKIDELRRATAKGYRVYLYYVATDVPEVGIGRVRERVANGGHDVPEHKIRTRHIASLENLFPALTLAYRAYVFDNSGREARLLAEKTPAGHLTLATEQIPIWFASYVLKHIEAE